MTTEQKTFRRIRRQIASTVKKELEELQSQIDLCPCGNIVLEAMRDEVQYRLDLWLDSEQNTALN